MVVERDLALLVSGLSAIAIRFGRRIPVTEPPPLALEFTDQVRLLERGWRSGSPATLARRAPTDPDVQNSRIRLFSEQVR
jgi:hypothetical protein